MIKNRIKFILQTTVNLITGGLNMWLHLNLTQFEGIVKITGVKAFYNNDQPYINFTYDNGRWCIGFDTKDECKVFFQELRKNLGNPNKILENEQIKDL